MPVRTPYWRGQHSIDDDVAGAPDVRATWLGHATVLAEVDGTVILTDPIFSQRASLSQWFGPKRYRPPGA